MLQTFATVTPAGRLVLPKPVRAWLRVTGGGQMLFRPGGAVVELRGVSADDGRVAALLPFLSLMDAALKDSPADAAAALPAALRQRLCARNPGAAQGRPAPANVTAGTAILSQGWRLLVHPVLQRQLAGFCGAGEGGVRSGGTDAPLWQALTALMLNRVPADPGHADFRLDAVPGWLRAKCCTGRWSLFFRTDPEARVILYAWLDDGEQAARQAVAAEPCVLFGSVSTVTQDGHVLLPISVRERLGITGGGRVEFGVARGALMMRAQRAPVHDAVLAAVVDVLEDAAEAPKATWSPAGGNPPKNGVWGPVPNGVQGQSPWPS